MKDNEMRGVILQKYYEKRRQGLFQWAEEDLSWLPKEMEPMDIYRISDQLADNNLIDWNPIPDGGGTTVGGVGKINALEVDVIEGSATPPISIKVDYSHVSVSGSSYVQVGNGNVQGSDIEIGKLVNAIDGSRATEAEKAEAKSKVAKLLENPLISTLTGKAGEFLKGFLKESGS